MSGKGERKVGLVTWLGGPNYGTVLQAYALWRKLSDLGCDVRVIRRYDFVWGVKLSLNHFLSKLGINILRTRDPKTLKMKRIRSFQAETFRCRHIVGSFGRSCVRKSFETFVCGSDQMWNTWNCFDPFFFLDFAEGRRRVAYAQSIGAATVKPDCEASVRRLIAGFDAVSVREKSAQVVLSGLSGRSDIQVCADPTMLLSKDEWTAFAEKADGTVVPKDRYILCYLLRERPDYEEIIAGLKEESGIGTVVIIPSGENPDLRIPGASIPDGVGAVEFVRLFSQASLVLTDSFHGTVFSVIFNRNFVNLKRFDDSSSLSQNSRLYDMAGSLGLGDRFYGSESGEWKNEMDYSEVNRRVDQLRSQSLKFLKDNIL